MSTRNCANIFVFTSFQGGSARNNSAYKFAQAYRDLSGKTGAFFEMNLFYPSATVELLKVRDKVKCSFMDYYMSNWPGYKPEDLGTTFTEEEKILLIPFTGARSGESLKPRFNFSEQETRPAMDRLLSILAKRKSFIVIDLPLAFSPLPLYLLDQADAIFYLFSPKTVSTGMAHQFWREADKRSDWKQKLIFLRNLTERGKDEGEPNQFPNEFNVPGGGALEGKSEEFHRAIAALAEKALKMPSGERTNKAGEQLDESHLERLREYQRTLRAEIVANLEKRFGLSDQDLRRKVEQHIEQVFTKFPPPTIPGCEVRAETRKYLIDEILGLGPLEEIMRDPEVDEIMVNGPNKIFVERRGKITLSDKVFNNADHVRAVIDRILIPVGRTVNERTPYVDARLNDGSRVHAIIPPLSLTGPMVTIRRFSREPYTVDDLICRFKTLTPQVAEFLKLCVKFRKNVVVSGGASSGKTTLLNILSSFIAPTERIICIEDSAELKLNLENLGRLEARQQGTESKTQVTIRDLVRNSLRMRPDRIVVGECRGEEALDMLQAMNTGHDGSLTTLHANSTRDALARLETMVLMAGVDLPLRAIREQIASSVNIVVQISRFSDGSRRVIEVSEITGIEETSIKVQTIYKFEKKWITEEGHVFGDVISTGIVPQFLKNTPGNLEETTKHLFINNV